MHLGVAALANVAPRAPSRQADERTLGTVTADGPVFRLAHAPQAEALGSDVSSASGADIVRRSMP